MTDSNRLAITEFATGSDGVATGNEMIAKLEAGAGLWACKEVLQNTPPGTPAEGDLYIVGTAGTGVWVGQDEKKALYYNAAWLFIVAIEGDLAYDQLANAYYRYDGADWVVTSLGGVVPTKATAGEVRSSAAGDKYIAPEVVESASALVALTDGANIALDWDAGINRSVTLAGNRTLDNPTNGQPGTWRTVIITQDGTGTRTLAFGTQYKFAGGTAPTLTTTAAAVDVLSILCVTASLFYTFSALDLK